MARVTSRSGKSHPRDKSPLDPREPAALLERRRFLGVLALLAGAGMAPGLALRALGRDERIQERKPNGSLGAASSGQASCLYTKDKVPDPQEIAFTVQYPGKDPVRLAGHFWYNREAADAGRKCPAIVELNPYRRRDGMMAEDSAYYPYFAYYEYLCFRVDLQGSGDSEGLLTDEYTQEELAYCVQVIEQIARHALCDGNVGMTGASWSAINSLMVSARDDCPEALKAIVAFCGTDDRYSDDVHYMNGAMMQDNFGWPSSMWGWLSLPPDPVTAGDGWKELWRERIRKADYWFKWWGAHQTRDSYWSDTSLLGRYDRVKVPVFIASGYADGYKNPVPRAVRDLAAARIPAQGALGPWGHSTNDPGPHFDWLPLATLWWDRWLKGKEPDPDRELPQLTVWLGESKEPDKSCCKKERGRWVAEDSGWAARVQEKILYLRPDKSLSGTPPKKAGRRASPARLLQATTMLETSSYGSCGNDDLPGDQEKPDRQSLHFDTAPLAENLDCFGYPEASLTLSCDKPLASIAVRLCEVSPWTEASHLVSYRFFNLCYRSGDMSDPQPIEPDTPFNVRIPLNVIGHTFKRGRKIRLSLSPSFFPTMWQSQEVAVLTLHTGPLESLAASSLSLPRRAPRAEDKGMRELLPPHREAACVNAKDYVPTLSKGRPASNSRKVEPILVQGKRGVFVRKVFDSGRYQYGGPLQGLWVDEVAEENYQILEDDPLSQEGLSSFKATLEREGAGGAWRVRCETTARMWTEKDQTGACHFKYRATLQTFLANDQGAFEPFEEKTVEGLVPRSWV